MKSVTTISIDVELRKYIKENHINLTKLVENSIKALMATQNKK